MPQSQPPIHRRTLRHVIDEALPTDTDLDSFLIDYFDNVHKRLSIGMERSHKVNLLIKLIDPQVILDALQNAHPESKEILAQSSGSTPSKDENVQDEDDSMDSSISNKAKSASIFSRILLKVLNCYSLLGDQSQPAWKRIILGIPLTISLATLCFAPILMIPFCEVECNQRTGHAGSLSVSFAKDGKFLLSSAGYVAMIWSTTTNKTTCTFTGHKEPVRASALSNDAEYALTASLDKTTRLWHVPSCDEVKTIKNQNAAWSVAFSPNGKMFAYTEDDWLIHIYDTRSKAEMRKLGGKPGIYIAIDFSPDSKNLIASQALNNNIAVFDLEQGTVQSELQGHTQYVWTARYSYDGSRIVTASSDKTVRIWDMSNKKLLHVLTGHTAKVASARFSQDGQKVISASDDHTARIWDVATGRQIITLVGHQRSVTDADFSPDGTQAVTSSFDGAVILWNAQTGEQIRQLKPMKLCIRNPAAC